MRTDTLYLQRAANYEKGDYTIFRAVFDKGLWFGILGKIDVFDGASREYGIVGVPDDLWRSYFEGIDAGSTIPGPHARGRCAVNDGQRLWIPESKISGGAGRWFIVDAPAAVTVAACTCDIVSLMARGCTCGHLQAVRAGTVGR